jgi:hypothetical protein
MTIWYMDEYKEEMEQWYNVVAVGVGCSLGGFLIHTFIWACSRRTCIMRLTKAFLCYAGTCMRRL